MIYEAVLGGDEEVLVGSVAGGGRWVLVIVQLVLHLTIVHCPGTMALLGCSIPREGACLALG